MDTFAIIELSEDAGEVPEVVPGMLTKEKTAGEDTDGESDKVALLFSRASLCSGRELVRLRRPPGLLVAGELKG